MRLFARARSVSTSPSREESYWLMSGVRRKTNICKTFGSTPFGIADNGKIVSFNNKCYESHGKSQGENAPISVFSEYAYTSALKRLLNSEENQLTIFAKKNKNGKMVYMTDRKLLFGLLQKQKRILNI